MELSDIAEGLEVVDEQRERGVAAVDDTDRDLGERLADHEAELPCDGETAAAVVETFTAGGDLEAVAEAGGVAPITAAKALHRLGVEGVAPLSAAERAPVREWLAGDRSRTDALAATGVDEEAFALAAFVETRDPIPGAQAAVDGALAPGEDAAVEKRDALDGTMSDAGELS
jgi:hypothetical protein